MSIASFIATRWLGLIHIRFHKHRGNLSGVHRGLTAHITGRMQTRTWLPMSTYNAKVPDDVMMFFHLHHRPALLQDEARNISVG